MCVTTNCIVCEVPAKSCSLVNGKCYVCRQTPVPQTPTPPVLNPVTPLNNYPDVYHTH